MKQLQFLVSIVFSLALLSICISAQSNNVIIYNDINFQGANMALSVNWNGNGGFDRNIKSIRVPSGHRVRK